MEKIKIILVDDHVMFLEGLKSSLEKYPFIEVLRIFDTVKEALQFLKINTVDLVITDMSMPDMNGIEFIKAVKQDYKGLKVLAISTFSPLHYEPNFYDGYLLKDTDIDTVIEAIKTIMYQGKTYFYREMSIANELNFSTNVLTKREKQITALIAQEYTVDEIAKTLFVSRHTVETHKKNIFLKLQVKSNAGLIKKAIQLGIGLDQ
ncbi:response regulator transcription factor [Aquimarina sp. 2201CG1-2-11]|uniref:response regulator transcription factor n=1 Tax=Aquimarina discodermiae TaxID=3231043 RepID=UPI0034624576